MTLQDLLKKLYAKYGREFKRALEEDLDYRSAVVTVNGKIIERTSVLKPGDEILISYPVAGG
jgi:molybdopterin converting factor small subunit